MPFATASKRKYLRINSKVQKLYAKNYKRLLEAGEDLNEWKTSHIYGFEDLIFLR